MARDLARGVKELGELTATVYNAGGLGPFLKQMLKQVKSDAEQAFDWLNYGYVSDVYRYWFNRQGRHRYVPQMLRRKNQRRADGIGFR